MNTRHFCMKGPCFQENSNGPLNHTPATPKCKCERISFINSLGYVAQISRKSLTPPPQIANLEKGKVSEPKLHVWLPYVKFQGCMSQTSLIVLLAAAEKLLSKSGMIQIQVSRRGMDLQENARFTHQCGFDIRPALTCR